MSGENGALRTSDEGRRQTPTRIQRSRAKGWRNPEGAIYVGRPSRWGNLWRAGNDHPWFPAGSRLMSAQDAVDFYEKAVTSGSLVTVAEVVEHLRDKDLVCWCRPQDPCHADVLLRLANADGASSPTPARGDSGAIS